MKYHQSAEQLSSLIEYCLQDVRAEMGLAATLPDLMPEEQQMFFLDAEINDRGIAVDVPRVRAIQEAIDEYSVGLKIEFVDCTAGDVKSPRQSVAFLEWLRARGYREDDLREETINEADLSGLPDYAKRALEIRQSLSKSSLAKLQALRLWACSDSRARGLFVFYGAGRTGRWGGRGPQPQNLPRPHKEYKKKQRDTEEDVGLFTENPFRFAEEVGDPFEYVPSFIRSCFCAPAGKKFLCADFSQVESRVLAWLAGEAEVLEVFQSGGDIYQRNADLIGEERFLGKTMELACQYGGSHNAVLKFGGKDMSEKKRRALVKVWREGHPATCAFWPGLEKAATAAVRNKGKVYQYRDIRFCCKENILKVLLPSGRKLHYWYPKVGMSKKSWGDIETLQFMGVGVTKKWVGMDTWGGRWAENIVQATARDLLRDAMLRLSAAGFTIVGHVHDEVICEEDEEDDTFSRFLEIFSEVPYWAEGVPIEADGWEGVRYGK